MGGGPYYGGGYYGGPYAYGGNCESSVPEFDFGEQVSTSSGQLATGPPHKENSSGNY